ncbi:MAG: biosynthetic peptidoglycan transglycosylase [Nannocystaceae bacterium]|nr:transglycosylase domain-containing protein [Myxococcales bacterium]
MLLVVLGGGAAAVAAYPRWAAPYVEEALVSRLAARVGGPVTIDEVTVDYGKIKVAGVVVGSEEGAQLTLDEVTIDFQREGVFAAEATITAVEARGGTLQGSLAACEALAQRLAGGSGEPRGEGRIKLAVDSVGVSELKVAVEAEGRGSVRGTVDARFSPADDRLELKVHRASATAGSRRVSASAIGTEVTLARGEDGRRAPAFPITVTVVGAATAITPKIAVAGVRGRVELKDPALSELSVELAGGFSDERATREEAATDEPPKVWSLAGDLRRDLSAGDLQLRMASFELGRVPQALAALPVEDSADATVGGRLDIKFAEGKAHLEGDLEVEGINVKHALLARRVVPDLGFAFEFVADVDPAARAVAIDHATVRRGEVELKLSGELIHTAEQAGRHYTVKAEVPAVACQKVLDALPMELVPGLNGFRLDGQFVANVAVDINFADLDNLVLEGKVDLDGCKVKSAPPLVAPGRLSGPFIHRAVLRDGTTRAVDLTPGSGSYTPLDQINYVVAAVMTTEDGGFWRHRGFLPSQFAKALRRNLVEGRIRLGASTITMQMVKNVLLSHERTLSRKLQEMFLVWYVERVLSKQRIMELYLNVIEFGPGIYGVTNAARHYFGKDPSELTAKEGAYLGLMLPSPVRRHVHYCNGELTPAFQTKLDRIFGLMASRGRIDEATYNLYKDDPIVFDRSDLDTPEVCKAEIKRLMDARHTQRAATGLLAAFADEALPEFLDEEEEGEPAGDPIDGDPADGDAGGSPAMDDFMMAGE